jgi:hypothetical protein
MRLIADIYDRPSMDFRNKADRQDVDVLRACSECLPRRPPGLGICQWRRRVMKSSREISSTTTR